MLETCLYLSCSFFEIVPSYLLFINYSKPRDCHLVCLRCHIPYHPWALSRLFIKYDLVTLFRVCYLLILLRRLFSFVDFSMVSDKEWTFIPVSNIHSNCIFPFHLLGLYVSGFLLLSCHWRTLDYIIERKLA